MDATGVSHIAVCVRDLDKSLAFYRDILGMHVTFDEVQDTTTGGLPHIISTPGRRVVPSTFVMEKAAPRRRWF